MEVFKRIRENIEYKFNNENLVVQTIDMHTAGEPLRVIGGGFPELNGTSILEYRKDLINNHDYLRTRLMYEPRGHADMYGCLLTPPISKDADFGVIFMHNEGYSTMCGHATIAIGKLAVEMGWVEPIEPVTEINIEAPCGLLKVFVHVKNGNVTSVTFENVPSFVVSLDEEVNVEGIGNVSYDLAYGGAFYAFVDAKEIGLDLVPSNYRQITKLGMDIKKAVINSNSGIQHPFEEDLSFLYGTIFIHDPQSKDSDSRNVCIFADGELDRSPTGSGVSARMAIHYKRGEIQKNEWMTIESIIGTTFKCCVKEVVNYGEFKAVIPSVQGTAFVTGQHRFIIDPDDPLKNGFILR